MHFVFTLCRYLDVWPVPRSVSLHRTTGEVRRPHHWQRRVLMVDSECLGPVFVSGQQPAG